MIESAEEFIRLRTSTQPELYGRAASEPASEAVWQQVIAEHPEMKLWVIHNKTVPVSILEMLADDKDEDVRFALAMKRKLTPQLFARLAQDPNDSVRMRVAYNPKTPVEVLQNLASDRDPQIAQQATKRLRAGGP